MEEQPVNEGANAPEDVSLNVQDIVNVVKIIDVVSGRGAVKGDEMSSVGRVRDRLVAFVNANTPQAPADGEGSETVDSAETEEVDVNVELED